MRLGRQVDMAEQQLDFLKEVQRNMGTAPDILYLSAVLNRLKVRPGIKLQVKCYT